MDKQEEWGEAIRTILEIEFSDLEDEGLEYCIGNAENHFQDFIRYLRSKDRDTLIERIRVKQYVITEEYDGEKMVKIQPNYAVNSVLEDVKQIILETLK